LLETGADERELAEHCEAGEVAALRRVLAPFTVARAAAAADVDPALLDQLVADVRTHRGRIAMHCGTGVTMSRDGVIAEWLRWVVLIASGSLDVATGMYFHRGTVNRLRARKTARVAPTLPSPAGRPELPRVVGQIPAVALADEIEAGNIQALFLTGGNPLTAFPQPARLEAALRTLDVLAVVDVAENRLTEFATHVLPATDQLERADIMLAELTALRSGMQATRAVVEPVEERRPVWWMFAALQRAMGRTTPGGVDPDDLTDEDFLRGVLARSPISADDVFAAGPHGVDAPIEYGWVHSELLPDGRWSIAPAALLERLAQYSDPAPAEFVLAPRREMAWSNSIAYGANAAAPVTRIHPDAVSKCGAADVVAVASDHGTVTAPFVADPTLRRDVVSMTHGHADANPGHLTSTDSDVDPITAMPRVAGLPIALADAEDGETAEGPTR
jgi:anaerobic selenocysteine-containing dehydrogenase